MGTKWVPDLSSGRGAKYIVLTQSIRDAVRSGDLPAGAQLPPVRDLAWDLGITPGTVARAYRLAVEEGLLTSTTGRGTFVADAPAPVPRSIDEFLVLSREGMTDLRPVRISDMGQGEMIRGAMAELAQQPHSYTVYPSPASDLPLRAALTDWIEPGLIGPLEPDDIVLSFGAQHGALMAIQSVLSGPSPVMFTETLAYPGFRNSAQLMRAQLIGIEMDQHGIRPDRLYEAYRAHGGQALVTSANVHNPTGICMPLSRRKEIADIARRTRMQVIEDDGQRIGPPPCESFRALLPDHGWYVSSLTKTFSSSLRVGYIVPPRAMVAVAEQVARSSFYGLPQPMIDLVTPLLRSGAAEQIRGKLLAEIDRRLRGAVNILGHWDVAWGQGVPFLWLRLPPGWHGSTFAMACEREGIQIKSADIFAVPGAPVENAVRLTINLSLPHDQLMTAFERVNQLLSAPPEEAPT